MHCRVAPRTPASALAQMRRMRSQTDIDFTSPTMLHLGMTFKAKVWITFDQHLPIHRSMGRMANCATLPERFMLEDKWPCLLAVTFRAILVQPGHGQPPRRFKYVRTMRIVALHTIHAMLYYRVMLREIEFSVCLQMTIEACRRTLSGVHYEFATSAAGFDVLTARSMA